jgi:hypothetical protein
LVAMSRWGILWTYLQEQLLLGGLVLAGSGQELKCAMSCAQCGHKFELAWIGEGFLPSCQLVCAILRLFGALQRCSSCFWVHGCLPRGLASWVGSS